MKSSIAELTKRVHEIKNGSEVLVLKEEISELIASPQFKQLSENDKDLVMDLLAKVNSKEERSKGCDPLSLRAGPGS